jgi:FAD/FMN-containing dehydrogenase
MIAVENRVIEEWRSVLPEDCVLTGDGLDPYRASCLSLERDVPAVLRPSSEEQVVDIVRVAAREKIPLYPVSGGHNWGYGSALPVIDGCAIVDLSRMNRVLHMDADLGLISLEPGVTQGQLYQYFRERNYDYFVPTTGAGPMGSIVGNALERGFGMTPQEDHFGAVTSVRAVLADGSIYQPFMSELGARLADGVAKWGIGPYVDGLFAQGNFGIVTAMQFSLVRKPEHIEVFAFTLKDASEFPALVESCRELLHDLRGPIGSIKLVNQRQVQMSTGAQKLGAGFNAAFAWLGFGVVHTKRSMIGAIRKSIRRALMRKVARLVFLNEGRVGFLKKAIRLLPPRIGAVASEPVRKMQHLLDIANGIPQPEDLRIAYQHVPWDENRPVIDPVKDGVGMLWYAPVIPLKRSNVEEITETVKRTLLEHGFEPAMTITTLSAKCAVGVVPIIYKKPGGKGKALRCFRELWERGLECGCYPYRVNIAVMHEMAGEDSRYWDTVAAIKSALDPDGILAPGRYGRI